MASGTVQHHLCKKRSVKLTVCPIEANLWIQNATANNAVVGLCFAWGATSEDGYAVITAFHVGVSTGTLTYDISSQQPAIIPEELEELINSANVIKVVNGFTAKHARVLKDTGLSIANFIDIGDLERRTNKEATRKEICVMAEEYWGLPFTTDDNKANCTSAKWSPSSDAQLHWAAASCLACYFLFLAYEERLVGMLKRQALPCPSDDCERYFASQKSLDHHRQVHHNDPSLPNSHPHKCPHCLKYFRTATALVQHVEVSHPGMPLPRPQLNPNPVVENGLFVTSDGEVVCPYELPCCGDCDVLFSTLDELAHHHRTDNHDQVRYACSECRKRFGTRSALEMHYDVTHGQAEDLTFVCDTCQRSFGTRDALYQHQQCVGHSLAEVCVVCAASFGSHNELLEHFGKTSHDTFWLCGSCPKKFPEKDALVKHESSTGHVNGFQACEVPNYAPDERSNPRQRFDNRRKRRTGMGSNPITPTSSLSQDRSYGSQLTPSSSGSGRDSIGRFGSTNSVGSYGYNNNNNGSANGGNGSHVGNGRGGREGYTPANGHANTNNGWNGPYGNNGNANGNPQGNNNGNLHLHQILLQQQQQHATGNNMQQQHRMYNNDGHYGNVQPQHHRNNSLGNDSMSTPIRRTDSMHSNTTPVGNGSFGYMSSSGSQGNLMNHQPLHNHMQQQQQGSGPSTPTSNGNNVHSFNRRHGSLRVDALDSSLVSVNANLNGSESNTPTSLPTTPLGAQGSFHVMQLAQAMTGNKGMPMARAAPQYPSASSNSMISPNAMATHLAHHYPLPNTPTSNPNMPVFPLPTTPTTPSTPGTASAFVVAANGAVYGYGGHTQPPQPSGGMMMDPNQPNGSQPVPAPIPSLLPMGVMPMSTLAGMRHDAMQHYHAHPSTPPPLHRSNENSQRNSPHSPSPLMNEEAVCDVPLEPVHSIEQQQFMQPLANRTPFFSIANAQQTHHQHNAHGGGHHMYAHHHHNVPVPQSFTASRPKDMQGVLLPHPLPHPQPTHAVPHHPNAVPQPQPQQRYVNANPAIDQTASFDEDPGLYYGSHSSTGSGSQFAYSSSPTLYPPTAPTDCGYQGTEDGYGGYSDPNSGNVGYGSNGNFNYTECFISVDSTQHHHMHSQQHNGHANGPPPHQPHQPLHPHAGHNHNNHLLHSQPPHQPPQGITGNGYPPQQQTPTQRLQHQHQQAYMAHNGALPPPHINTPQGLQSLQYNNSRRQSRSSPLPPPHHAAGLRTPTTGMSMGHGSASPPLDMGLSLLPSTPDGHNSLPASPCPPYGYWSHLTDPAPSPHTMQYGHHDWMASPSTLIDFTGRSSSPSKGYSQTSAPGTPVFLNGGPPGTPQPHSNVSSGSRSSLPSSAGSGRDHLTARTSTLSPVVMKNISSASDTASNSTDGKYHSTSTSPSHQDSPHTASSPTTTHQPYNVYVNNDLDDE